MKKSTLSKFLLFCGLFLMLGSARAQYVAIPDTVFGDWLNNNGYSACIAGSNSVGWRLDTTCPAVINASSIQCNYSGIYDLTGITFFKNLNSLSFIGNSVTNLPSLPATLTSLDCRVNPLTSLPPLPPSLTTLFCNETHLTSLPNLPSSLDYLNCTFDTLASLPPLPNSLTSLYCEYCSLTSLPVLPNSLLNLFCDNNQLTNLPNLPSSLYDLRCNNNHLISIPVLPSFMTNFDCSYNPGLFCLSPVNTNHFNFFGMGNTGIQCIPNHFTASHYDVNPDTMPLCDPKSGCNFYYNIVGNVHLDTTNNCILDSINPGPGLSNLKVRLVQNGNIIQQLYTTSSGFYSFHTDSFTNYLVEIDTARIFSNSCPGNGYYNISLSPTDSVTFNNNFGLTCSSFDYSVDYIVSSYVHPFRYNILTPVTSDITGFASQYNARCIGNQSGTVTTIYKGAIQYVGPVSGAIAPSFVSGDTLTYIINNLDSLQAGSIAVMFATDTNAIIGSSVFITSIVSPPTPDGDPNDNTLTQSFVIHDPHDPNLKEVSPAGTIDTGAAQWLTYTVHFQNTGNDTAYTVIVKDTLSQNVDASSFQYLASSHHAVIQLFGSAMVFTFPKINLVDSATNPPLSQGWIQYKVKTKPNLPLGTQIKNTASIYFDLNPAIRTNTTVNTVQIDTARTHVGIADLETASILLYPNPATLSCTISVSNMSSIYTAQLLDISGREVSNLGVLKNGVQTFSVSTIAKGIYMLRLSDSQGRSQIRKLVIE
jgi:uncharacterized repeat protein (TIGR01451 family)